jgi:hypothetical protein
MLRANDWFDATYKNDDSFDVDRIIRDYERKKPRLPKEAWIMRRIGFRVGTSYPIIRQCGGLCLYVHNLNKRHAHGFLQQ